MASRNWDNLSDSYRGRLERSGVSRSDYESGISLKAARGHATTPERPERAEKQPGEFQAYLFNRDKLVNDIIRAKQSLFGSGAKYNATRSRRNVSYDSHNKPRSIAALRRILAALNQGSTFEEVADELEDDDLSALYYH